MTTIGASPREVLLGIRAQLASLPSGTALERELRRAESAQIARLHRIAQPLDLSERRLKAGFERMKNGLERMKNGLEAAALLTPPTGARAG